MKSSTMTRLRWFVLVIVIAGLGMSSWLGWKILSADEMQGLELFGRVYPTALPTIPNESIESWHQWTRKRSLALLGEPTSEDLSQKPDGEFYRFTYEPWLGAKPHAQIVCISIWNEVDRYWVRSSAIEFDETRR